jgi:hypothetical protein
MKTSIRSKLVLLVSLGLLSVAAADRSVATHGPAATELVDLAPEVPAQPVIGELRYGEAPTACTSAFPPAAEASGTSAWSCPTGTVLTCCSCGVCDCRSGTISPQNFCRFFVCP